VGEHLATSKKESSSKNIPKSTRTRVTGWLSGGKNEWNKKISLNFEGAGRYSNLRENRGLTNYSKESGEKREGRRGSFPGAGVQEGTTKPGGNGTLRGKVRQTKKGDHRSVKKDV